MTQIFLITGFLGSGKTTFLTHLLTQQQLGKASVGVIINEFGAIDIDGERLESNGVTTTKLTNGSIFCACLKEDFTQALVTLLQQDLGYIFIESSGLSDPSNMVFILDFAAYLAKKSEDNFDYLYYGSICLVDGKYFLPTLERMVNTERQIQQSATVLVNKCDLIDEDTRNKIFETIRSIRPNVPIHAIEQGAFDLNLLKIPEIILPDQTTNTIENRPLTCSIALQRACTPKEIQALMHCLQEHFYRIKGSFMYKGVAYQVDSVYKTIEIRPSSDKAAPADNGNAVNDSPSPTMASHAVELPTNPTGLLVCIASTGIRSVSAVSLACKEILKTGYHIET